MTERTLYRIRLGGLDVSNDLQPILEQVKVTDGSDNEADDAQITVADVGGQVIISQPGDTAEIELGRTSIGMALVFEGVVDEVRSKGSRSGGRQLVIDCKSADMGSPAKEPQELYWDDKSVQDILGEAAEAAGLNITLDPALASIVRDYEAMDGEDFLTFGARLAREVGGTFKVMGKRAVMAKRNSGMSAAGAPMPTFVAEAGRNLLEWDIAPLIARPVHAEFAARWFDFAKNEWMTETAKGTAKGKFRMAPFRPNKDISKESSESEKTEGDRKAGQGSCSVLGSFEPQAEGQCQIVGARPGVDGTYIIETVTHTASRGSGYETQIDLARPDGGAGTDAR